MEQSIVFVFAYPLKTRRGTPSKEDALFRNRLRAGKIGWLEYNVATEDREYVFFCLRSRLATILLQQKEYAMFQKPLNFKAKPFYSKRLEQIFDIPPDFICCNFHEDEMVMVDRELLVHPARDAMAVDTFRYDGLNFDSMSNYHKKYARLVQIEARQQMLDIRSYDMHNVRAIPVMFDKSDRHQRKCWLGSNSASKLYRGFLSKRMTNRRGLPSLIAVRVPSILEGQPSVHLGTIVRVKSSEPRGHEYEYNMICCGIDGVLVFLLPPVGFWEETPLGRSIENSQVPGRDLLISIRFGYSSRAMRRMLDVDSVSRFIPEDSFTPCVETTPLLTRREDVEKLALELQSRSFLNEQQATAISSVVSGAGRIAPFSIIGPPGTGKTFTLTHCACEVLNKHSAAKILCCAPQNFTADIICSELRKKGIDSKKMLRLNDPRRPIYSTKEDVLDFCCIDDAGGTFLVPDELDEYSVIVCTCLSSEYLSPGSRTHVMIDEAGQALLPESLLALQALCYDKDPLNTGWGSILCGDPKQLGPIVRNKLASQCGLQKSLLQVLSEGKNWNGMMLCQNYRSSNDLLFLPSKLFYSSTLYYAGDANSVLPPSHKWDFQNDEQALPCVFYGVNGQQEREGESSSFMNKIEALAVVDLVTKLLGNSSISEDDIGVLAMYRKQVYLIRNLFREEGLRNIRVGTIEDYQGQEERIIIISTVLSDLNDLPVGSFARSFFQNPNRFNVAITRAKALLVTVGNPRALAADSNWKTFIRHCYARSSVFGARSAEIDSAWNEEDEGEEEAIMAAISQIAVLGPGTANMEQDFDPFDEDCPWRIMI